MLHVVAGGSWIGRLVAFVDFDSADPISNEFVLLRVGELLFVQYNRAKDFNAGTSLHQDEVVVVAGEGGLGSSSVLLAGLGTGEAYSWNGMGSILLALWTTQISPCIQWAPCLLAP